MLFVWNLLDLQKNMNVDNSKTIIIDSEHSIEIGDSSWLPLEKVIRRRKDLNGRFDPHSSSEIPIHGHVNISRLVVTCLKYDLLDQDAMTNILNEILESVTRQKSRITIL